MSNKYSARKTWSQLCQRQFDSRAEAIHGEELKYRELAGDITGLEYQVRFILSKSPRVSIMVDFKYVKNGVVKYQDTKGMETREFRVKRIWLQQQQGIDVELVYKR